jgi:hypothetical protein
MKLIERLKPEVLENLKTMLEEYPYTYEEIIHQLNAKSAWSRLEYIVAMDIEHYGKVEWIGDAFYEVDEMKNKNIKETEIN